MHVIVCGIMYYMSIVHPMTVPCQYYGSYDESWFSFGIRVIQEYVTVRVMTKDRYFLINTTMLNFLMNITTLNFLMNTTMLNFRWFYDLRNK